LLRSLRNLSTWALLWLLPIYSAGMYMFVFKYGLFLQRRCFSSCRPLCSQLLVSLLIMPCGMFGVGIAWAMLGAALVFSDSRSLLPLIPLFVIVGITFYLFGLFRPSQWLCRRGACAGIDTSEETFSSSHDKIMASISEKELRNAAHDADFQVEVCAV